MKRKDVKVIYDKLSDTEKRAWSKEANYESFTGLYKYLRANQSLECYDSIIQALKIVVGADKFNRLMYEGVGINNSIIEGSLDQSRNILIKNIFNTKDREKLKQIQNDIELACKNQLERIEIESAN